MNTNIIEQSAILIAKVTHLPDRKHLPGQGVVRLVPQLASLLQLRLLFHQEEIVGVALLALAPAFFTSALHPCWQAIVAA